MTGKKTKTTEAEIVQEQALVSQPDQQNAPAQIISQAITKGANLEQIEKLMVLQQKWEENEARKAYNQAMAAFKADPPKIEKTKLVDFTTDKGRTKYKYGALADAAEKINKAMSPHGLSATWTTEQRDDGQIKVTCKVTHKMGHSESTSLFAKPDATGNKNTIQQVGSTITYLERYTLLALTGLATHDMDDDGKGAADPPKTISEAQANELHAMITDHKLNIKGTYLPKFLEFMKVPSTEDTPAAIEDILAKDFGKAKATLSKAIKSIKK